MRTDAQNKALALYGLRIGVEVAQVAEDLGIGEACVHAIAVENNIALSGSMTDRIKILLRRGRASGEIKRELGCSYGLITQTRRAMGDEI